MDDFNSSKAPHEIEWKKRRGTHQHEKPSHRSPKKRKRRLFGWVLLASFVVVTGAEWGVLSHYNSLMGGDVTKNLTLGRNSSNPPVQHVSGVSVVNNNPNCISVSEHKTLVAWADSGNTLHIDDLSTGKSVQQVPFTDKIDYVEWIGDDKVFVGTESDGQYSHDLHVNTVDAASGEVRDIHDFQGYAATSIIQDITYSQYTNDIYIVIGGKTRSIVTHFGTMSNYSQVPLGERLIVHAEVSQTDNTLYFQDQLSGTSNVLRYNQGSIGLLKDNSVLLRVMNNDAFFAVVDSNGNALRIDEYHDGKNSIFYTFNNPVSAQNVFVDDDGHVQVVTSNAVVDERTNNQTKIPSDATTFIHDNVVFVISPDGTLTVIS